MYETQGLKPRRPFLNWGPFRYFISHSKAVCLLKAQVAHQLCCRTGETTWFIALVMCGPHLWPYFCLSAFIACVFFFYWRSFYSSSPSSSSCTGNSMKSTNTVNHLNLSSSCLEKYSCDWSSWNSTETVHDVKWGPHSVSKCRELQKMIPTVK